jgi:hypothetical protein
MNADPRLSTRCTIPGLSLWFGKAQLFDDRVRLTGWTWSGRYERVIPLQHIDRVKWWAVMEDVNFLLHLRDGSAVPLYLHRNAGTWNYEVRDLLGLSGLAQSAEACVRPRRELAA